MDSSDKILAAIKAGDMEQLESYLEKIDKLSPSHKASILRFVLGRLLNNLNETNHPYLLIILRQIFERGAPPNVLYPNSGHPLAALYDVIDDPDLCESATELFIRYGLDIQTPQIMSSAIQNSLQKDLLTSHG